MIFSTERLILRPWQETDAESLYEYASSPDIGPAAGWQIHKSIDESRQIIKSVLSAPNTYAVIDMNTLNPIGSIGLMIGEQSNIGLPEDEAEIGYWIGRPFWGKGFMPEAVREILRYAFKDLNLKKVWCGYFDGNEKSKRVSEKCGFKYEYTIEKFFVKPLNEERTLHATSLSRKSWEQNKQHI